MTLSEHSILRGVFPVYILPDFVLARSRHRKCQNEFRESSLGRQRVFTLATDVIATAGPRLSCG